ncbi:substrate-binding domain-containing protein [Sansalvadorimonas sp. 2012CJ34-2]|uniref:Substrate-binding domain-containing protein n=1 Tax=Parendozoicomonas callyspongiae TaxID=2942213 RepID=A0ABT0PJU3_9GAMM|nr:substrate-binding domain-containing protein [Sansalvadorimonas sp. 2012CJ34-2]MCL6271638.1 substrate-binding domain-containing protein [Sansalvadorimonas sp. 2012CJ34-2]
MAQLLVQRLPAGAKVAIIAGPPGHQASYERLRVARGWLKSNKLKVIAVEAAHWNRERAESVAMKLLEKYLDLDAIMTMNDDMALGALRAADLVKPGKVLITGFDGEECVLAAIRSGKILATVDWYPDRQGIYAIKKCWQELPVI